MSLILLLMKAWPQCENQEAHLWLLFGRLRLELSLDFLLSSDLRSVPMWNSLLWWHRYLSPWVRLPIVQVHCHGWRPATPVAQLRPYNRTPPTASCSHFAWDPDPNPTDQRWHMKTNDWLSSQSDNVIRTAWGNNSPIYCVWDCSFTQQGRHFTSAKRGDSWA